MTTSGGRATSIVLIAGLALALLFGAGAATAAKKISGKNIKKGAVAAKHLSPGAVTSPAIEDGSIAASDLGANSVGTSALQDDAVDGGKILDGSVTSSDVADELIPPGIAYVFPDATIAIGNDIGTRAVVASVTLLAPVDGHITVTSSGNGFCSSASSPDLVFQYQVTESDATQTLSPERVNAVPANDWGRFSSNWSQPVVAGATQVELLAYCGSSVSGTMFAESLTVMFFPNRYE